MSDCKSCGDIITDATDLPLPVSGSEVAVKEITVTPACPTTVTVVNKLCSEIKDQCGCATADPIPVTFIKNTNAFAIPACGQTVDVLFDKKVTGFSAGLEMYAVDSMAKTIRLKIQTVTPDNKLVLVNTCSSCCSGTKAVGESVPAGTSFSWNVPQCCGSTTPSSSSSECLVGTFHFPAVGQTRPANVKNSFSLNVGAIYSLGGFLWKLTARVTSTQVLLENVAPGNGTVAGGFIEGGDGTQCVYPFTPVSDVDPCNDSATASVALIGCTPTGLRKLSGDSNCAIPVYDSTTGLFTAKQLYGGSQNSGPHYIQYDKNNPCNSTLVYAPDIAGLKCSTISCSLYLTPTNQVSYEVEVSTTAPFSAVAPGNIVTLGGHEFTVTAIVVAGTPGKIRLAPRFVITASETIAVNSQVCTLTGCQPFPAAQWSWGGTLDAHGMKIFCASDGLRSMPDHNTDVASTDYTDGTDLSIDTVGTYSQGLQTIGVSNPSVTRDARVSGTLAVVYQLDLDTDGEWDLQTLFNVDAPPVVPFLTVRATPIKARFDVEVVTNFAFTLAFAQTKTIQFNPTVKTLSASANNAVKFLGYKARLVTHLTTTV